MSINKYGKNKFTRFILFLAILWFFNVEMGVSQKPIQRFFVAGHSYGSPNNPVMGLYPPFYALLKEMHLENPFDFGILTGDVVFQPTEERWDSVLVQLNGLDLPFFIAAGNHDMGDRDLFRTKIGASDTVFNLLGNTFLILDNTKNGWNMVDDQKKLMEKAISMTDTNGVLLIFIHNVLWSELSDSIVINSEVGKGDTVYFQRDYLEPIYRSGQQCLLFAGDVGAMEYSPGIGTFEYKGIKMITSGMGNGASDYFLKVEVYEKGVSIFSISINDGGINPITKIRRD